MLRPLKLLLLLFFPLPLWEKCIWEALVFPWGDVGAAPASHLPWGEVIHCTGNALRPPQNLPGERCGLIAMGLNALMDG